MTDETQQNFRNLAIQLLEHTNGYVTEANIKHLQDTFEGIRQGCTNNWEKWLTDETNDVLAQDNVTCEVCGSKIRIKRSRTLVSVEHV